MKETFLLALTFCFSCDYTYFYHVNVKKHEQSCVIKYLENQRCEINCGDLKLSLRAFSFGSPQTQPAIEIVLKASDTLFLYLKDFTVVDTNDQSFPLRTYNKSDELISNDRMMIVPGIEQFIEFHPIAVPGQFMGPKKFVFKINGIRSKAKTEFEPLEVLFNRE